MVTVPNGGCVVQLSFLILEHLLKKYTDYFTFCFDTSE